MVANRFHTCTAGWGVQMQIDAASAISRISIKDRSVSIKDLRRRHKDTQENHVVMLQHWQK